MKTILVVRHGHTEAPRGSFCGSTDVPLSQWGRDQSVQCVKELLENHVQLVITSGMQRTDYVGSLASPHGIAHHVEGGFKEVDFGTWEGKTWSEIESTYPQPAKQWLADPTGMRFPDGEAMEAFRTRVQTAWARVLDRPEEVIAIVAHSGVLGHVLQHARGDEQPPYIEHGQTVRLLIN
jgi:alpha-ribazole phosphatase